MKRSKHYLCNGLDILRVVHLVFDKQEYYSSDNIHYTEKSVFLLRNGKGTYVAKSLLWARIRRIFNYFHDIGKYPKKVRDNLAIEDIYLDLIKKRIKDEWHWSVHLDGKQVGWYRAGKCEKYFYKFETSGWITYVVERENKMISKQDFIKVMRVLGKISVPELGGQTVLTGYPQVTNNVNEFIDWAIKKYYVEHP